MKITCAACHSSFRIHAENLPAGGARSRCPSCSEWIVIRPERPGAAVDGGGLAGDALFDLPPLVLVHAAADDEDLFGLQSEPGPATGAASAAAPVAAAGATPRRSGLRGWLSRLFGLSS